MKLNDIRATSLLLGLVNLGLAMSAVMIWRVGETRIHEPEHLAAHEVSLPDLTVLTPTAATSVDIAKIRDNAVFYSRRSFYEPPPPSQSIPSPDYDFTGSMDLPQGKRVAFVKAKFDHASRMLHLGDDLEGWRVEGIEPNKVVLVRDDHRTELTSSAPPPMVGLIHGTPVAHVAQTAPHVLGAQATTYPLPPQQLTTARTYRPPP
jgi:hypothetical protein